MIHNDSFAKLLDLINVLQVRVGPRTNCFLGAAACSAALTIILRRLIAKQPNFIMDYTKVARKVNRHGLQFDEWDFIIVGGGRIYLFRKQCILWSRTRSGTAGCVLASRLSENPNLRVLLIEAGGRLASWRVVFTSEILKFSQLQRCC